MAVSKPTFTNKPITSNYTVVKGGNFALQWGPNFITGQLPIQKVEVLVDCIDGPVNVQFPASTELKSKGVILLVSAINVTDDNTATFWPVTGEKIAGRDSIEVSGNKAGGVFYALAAGAWGN